MANKNIKGITIQIGGDTSKLETALKKVNTTIRGLNSELKATDKALKLDPKNTELLSQKQQLLKENIAQTSEKLKQLQSLQSRMGDYNKLTDEQQSKYRDLSRQIDTTKHYLTELTKEYKNFGNVATQQLKAVGNKLEETGNKVKDIGKKFTVPSAVAAGALTGLSAAAVNFESAFAGVTKTVDGTEEQLSKIKQGILDLAKSTSSSASEIAAVAEVAGQLGVSTDNILNFTEQMVRLGDSTNLSAEEASSSIAQLYNVMGSDINTVDRFGSTLVALGNNAATTEKDILEMATRIASSGHQIGLSEKEVLALSTTLSSVGLSAEAGGSAISKVLSRIDKDIATNNDSVKEWAKLAGVSSAEFKKQWQTNTMGAIQSVIAGLGNVKETGGNLNVLLGELDINELRTTDSMKRLSSASDLLNKMIGISNDAWEENDALLNESNKRYDTTESKINQTKASITELAVKLGQQLLPIIQKILTAISKVVNWFTKLSPGMQTILLTIVAIIAAVGPVVTIIGNIITLVGTVTKVISVLNAVLLANPIGLIVAATAAVIAGLVLLYNKCEWFRDLVNGIFEWISGVFKAVIDFFADNWQSLLLLLVNPFAGAFKLLYDNCEGFRNFVNNFIDKIKTAISNTINTIVTNVSNFVNKIWETFKELPGKIIDIGKNMIKGLWEGMKSAWEGLKKNIKEFGNGIVKTFKDIFSIHSPSRVMRDQIGKNLGYGVIEGIEETKSDVDKAISDLSKGIETSVNPVINPSANTNPLILQIENFNNNSQADIQRIAKELEFYRKNSALAKGGSN